MGGGEAEGRPKGWPSPAHPGSILEAKGEAEVWPPQTRKTGISTELGEGLLGPSKPGPALGLRQAVGLCLLGSQGGGAGSRLHTGLVAFPLPRAAIGEEAARHRTERAGAGAGRGQGTPVNHTGQVNLKLSELKRSV